MAIRIEIEKSFAEGKYNLRIGDITGSIESTNISEEEVLEEIREQMRKIKGVKP